MSSTEIAFALRRLLASRGFTLVTLITLAAGIGVNLTLFSVADAVVFRPLPVADQDRLVVGGEGHTDTRAEVSFANFADWRDRTRTFDGLAAVTSSNWTIALDGDEPVTVAYRPVSWDFFDVLGVRPAAGRTFAPEDDRRGVPHVAIISHGFWQRQFGGGLDIVGRSVVLGDQPFTIVGVMPRGFAYPPGADAWTPLVPALASVHGPGLPDFLENRGAALLHVVGRLRGGTTLPAARDDLNRIIGEIGRLHGRPDNISARLTPLVDEMLGPARTRMWMLMAAVVVLLLVAAGNVAGLMIARAAGRRRDHAIRLALGATRWALARELLLESGILAAAATVLAILAARAALPIVLTLLPERLPRLEDATLDLRGVAFAAAAGIATAMVCWIVPVLGLRDLRIEPVLRKGRTGTAAGPGQPARRLLVGLEVAAAVLLVTCAGLLYRSVDRLRGLDLGFDAGHLIAAAVELPPRLAAASAEEVDDFYDSALDAVASLPMVESVAAAGSRPLKGPIGLDSSWSFEGQGADGADRNPWVNTEPITSGYFATMRVPVREGRPFDARDRTGSLPVVIVNERLARWAWPRESAVGKRVRVAALGGTGDSAPWWTVVGVVADVRYRELGSVPLDVYVPARQSLFPAGDVMVRTRGSAAAAVQPLRSRLRELNREGVIGVALMEEEVAAHQAPWRASLRFFQFFAGLTIVLAVIGVYSMVDAAVAARSRDTGVRLALGASRWQVLRNVMADGGRVVAAGAVAGVVVSVAGARIVGTLLFEVSPFDALTLTISPVLVAAAGITACLRPALRASRLDPAITLRAE